MLLLYRRCPLFPRHVQIDLHSTMLLLYRWKRFCGESQSAIYIPLCFYFIKECMMAYDGSVQHLHSTMLLLYPYRSACMRRFSMIFTFHYASTLSGNRYENFLLGFLFTFHYASTLSGRTGRNNSNSQIYIPLCFYFIQSLSDEDRTLLNLHSTMLLLYPMPDCLNTIRCPIYIPLCFYFISPSFSHFLPLSLIYIPLCFYFISAQVGTAQVGTAHLHSTMLLLYLTAHAW